MNVCAAAGVQAGVAAVDVGRVGADGQQQRQDRAQPVAHADGAVGALDADVDVDGERVVAPGDVLQPLLDAAVVLGVDDVLLAVVAERVRAGRAERDAVLAGEREQPPARVAPGGRARRRRRRRAPERISISDEISSPAIDSASTGSAAPASRSSSKRGTSSSVSGSTSANSSSMPTVKSAERLEGLARGGEVDHAGRG